jgi:uncharacterized protein (DUF1501 family)
MSDRSSRREFLKRCSALSLAGRAAPWAVSLAALGEASAATASDYKALVCVFLYGGNDYGNTLIPYDTANYNLYQSLRPTLAYARDSLAATVLTPTVALPATRQYALAPELGALLPIFDAGKLGVLLNIGTLVQPTTKAQYTAKSVQLPPKLFSHNDQQSIWQSSAPEGSTSGWGGRLGDLFISGNGNSTFTCVNVSGNAVFLSGKTAVQYQVTPNGSVALNALKTPLFGSTPCTEALRTLITAPRTHLMESELNRVMKRAIDANDQLTLAIGTAPTINTPFPGSNALASQLKMVAQMIASSAAVGARRQVFFVSMGGFDNHDGLTTVHPGLLSSVGSALAAFYNATVELGVSNQVTTFSASDFGRTLTSNNNGSDHGWGSMHFVLGGSVVGKSFYGTPPVVANNGPDDVGQGRLLPTLSVDQLGATLGKWLGASPSDLATVLPNLHNYNAGSTDLGFLA